MLDEKVDITFNSASFTSPIKASTNPLPEEFEDYKTKHGGSVVRTETANFTSIKPEHTVPDLLLLFLPFTIKALDVYTNYLAYRKEITFLGLSSVSSDSLNPQKDLKLSRNILKHVFLEESVKSIRTFN